MELWRRTACMATWTHRALEALGGVGMEEWMVGSAL